MDYGRTGPTADPIAAAETDAGTSAVGEHRQSRPFNLPQFHLNRLTCRLTGKRVPTADGQQLIVNLKSIYVRVARHEANALIQAVSSFTTWS